MQNLTEFEGQILLFIQNNLRVGWLTPFMKAVSFFCDHGGLMLILSVAILMIIPKTRKTGVTAAVSLALNFIIANLIIKNAVARIRPYEVIEGLTSLVAPLKDFSFPSGHAANSFAVAVVIFKRTPRKVGIPVIVFASLISLSRLYLGVHYPTDMICGILLGTLVALAVCRFFPVICVKFSKKNTENS